MTIAEYTTQLKWRYATKQFDPAKKLSAEQLQFVKDVLQLSPSSTGLQPWKFVLVTDPAVQKELAAKAYNQAQLTTASLIVVLCASTEVNEKLVEKVVATSAEARHQPVASLEQYRQMMAGLVSGKNPEQLREWTSDQVYIALGMLLSACAAVGLDACPMEGFDRAGFDEILNLKNEGCTSYAICAVGFRSPADENARLPKARLAQSDIIIEK